MKEEVLLKFRILAVHTPRCSSPPLVWYLIRVVGGETGKGSHREPEIKERMAVSNLAYVLTVSQELSFKAMPKMIHRLPTSKVP